MGSRFSYVLAFVLSLAVILPLGCSKRQNQQQTIPTIRVGHVGHDHHLALYYAALAGSDLIEYGKVHLQEIQPREVYDLVEGGNTIARLHLVKVGGGSAMPASMARGEIEIGLGGIMPVAKIADSGSNIKVIAPLQTDGDMLVMNNDFQGKSWEDFVNYVKGSDRPVRMGYKAPFAVAKLIFEHALKHEGIFYSYDLSDAAASVILVNMSSEIGYLPLLERGDIDGFVMNQPAAAVTEFKGVGKIVCDLSDLPPGGKWKNHPCCCVVAADELMQSQPEVIRAFALLMRNASHAINTNQDKAIEYASKWTGNSIEIEKISVPSISYVDTDVEPWLVGLNIWLEMVDDLDLFTGKFAKKENQQIVNTLCDFKCCSDSHK